MTITSEMVQRKLKKLKANKSSGPDGIHVNILREAHNFDKPLALMFNTSLSTSVIPQDWKDANITPLFKTGSRTKCNNYRPV